MDANCMQVAKLLFAYVDGELSEKDRRFVEEHLEACAPCLDEKEKERLVKSFVSDEKIAMPAGLREKVLATLENNSTSSKVVPLTRPEKTAVSTTGGWMAMAASVALLAASFYFIQTTPVQTAPHVLTHTADLSKSVLTGDCVCVDCHLRGIPCPDDKHTPGLIEDDGTLWTLIPGEKTAELYANFEAIAGEHLRIEGRVFSAALRIEVTSYTLL